MEHSVLSKICIFTKYKVKLKLIWNKFCVDYLFTELFPRKICK